MYTRTHAHTDSNERKTRHPQVKDSFTSSAKRELVLREALALRPSHPATHAALGDMLLHQGDAAGVLRHYGAAIASTSPRMTDGHRAHLLRKQAKLFAKKSLAQQGGQGQGQGGGEGGETREGYEAQARASFEQLLALRGENPDAASLDAFAGFLLSQQPPALEEAAGVLQRLVALRPEDADVAVNLGGVLLQTGQFGQAAEVFARAVGLRPTDAGARSFLGVAHAGAGDRALARGHLEAAAKGGDTQAETNLARFLAEEPRALALD
jgi:Flp pilus assembly protein TadD